MHIMLELPTIKTDFLFENSQDFNQTTHARPQHPIVFIHNISLYFNCISSVKYVFKWSCHGHVMPFSTVRPKHKPKNSVCLVWKVGKVLMHILECQFFCSFHIPKWQLATKVLKSIRKDLIRKYFACYIIFQLF